MGVLDVPGIPNTPAARTALAQSPEIAGVIDTAVQDAPGPAWKRPTMPQVKMVQGTQAGHAWTLTGAATGSGADTSDYMLGTQSLKVIATNPTAVNVDYSLGTASFSMTDKGLVFFVKFSDVTAVNGMVVYLGTNGFAVDWTGGNVLAGSFAGEAGQYIKSNEWVRFFIPFAQLQQTSGGTFDRSTVRRVRITLSAQAGKSVTMWLNGLGTYDQRVGRPTGSNPRISFTFDDSDISQWTKAKPALDKYGWTATWFPIQSIIGAAGRMTLAQLKALRKAGHEIGCHAGATHTSIDTLTQAQRIATFQAQRKYLLDNDLGVPESYAYPNGTFDFASLQDVARYFASARTVYSFSMEAACVPDPYRIRSLPLGAGLSLAQAKTLVDQAENWVVITVHDLVDSGAVGNQWTTADFTALADYIATKNIDVIPMGTVVAGG